MQFPKRLIIVSLLSVLLIAFVTFSSTSKASSPLERDSLKMAHLSKLNRLDLELGKLMKLKKEVHQAKNQQELAMIKKELDSIRNK